MDMHQARAQVAATLAAEADSLKVSALRCRRDSDTRKARIVQSHNVRKQAQAIAAIKR